MKRLLSSVLVVLSMALTAGAEIRMAAEVDATDLPRKLLHTRMTVPVTGGKLDLWYPKWIPGIHGPRGPIQNLAGLRIETPAGEPVHWKRDDTERYLFHVTPPAGVDRVVVHLDYVCSQPSVNSRGIDSYGNSQLGVINWNTCLLYPDGYAVQDIAVELSLTLPDGWKHASALPVRAQDGATAQFAPFSFHDVVDSPLIAGPHLRTIDLSSGDLPPVHWHIASESPGALNIDEALVEKYRAMVAEAGALFGGAHFDEYHLLLFLSDGFPNTGLEHLRSSLNGLGERDLEDEKKVDGWAGYLIPHEFAHSWCGKYRRPAGMATPDFHTPKRTNLLWIYEGLDQYLGEILCVRAGIWSLETYKETLALKLSGLMHQRGRNWRPLEDTAVDSYHLRGGSPSWGTRRRGQDYYNEGLLLWLEADAIIRQETDNRRSLDDFCRAFMGPDLPDVAVHPFTLHEVLALLNDVAPYDWEGFIRNWVEWPMEELPLTVVERLGYRIQYSAERPARLKESEGDRKYVSAMDSLGMAVSHSGAVRGSLVPGMAADLAGMAPGHEVVGVNGWKFTPDRFRDAIRDSATRRGIELLVLDGEVFKTVKMDYADGLKYLELVRNGREPDRIEAIVASQAK